MSARSRRKVLAARTLCRALSLPRDDPLRTVAEATAPQRLRTTTGWRQVRREALEEAGAAPMEAGACAAPLPVSRLRLTGSIHLDPAQLRDADLVAALVAGYHRHREPLD